MRHCVRRPLAIAALTGCFLTLTTSSVTADIVATGFFSGTIERFDPVSGVQDTLATVASPTDPFPGLSGLAFDQPNNVLYASARISNRVYRIDATTGSVLDFWQLANGSSPAGLALDGAGNLYVANNGGNTISVFDPVGIAINTIALPNIGVGDNLPNGMAFDSQGRMVISTFAGGGLFRYDPSDSSVVSLAPAPLANGQVAIDDADRIYVGGTAFSNDVLRFEADGSFSGSPFLTVDQSLLPTPMDPFVSLDFTSPTGVTIDADGNLIVAALGRTNPTSAGDSFQSNGGLWRFSPDGALLQSFLGPTPLTPFSSVIVLTAIPEPNLFALGATVGLTGLLTRRNRRAVPRVI